MDSIKEAIYILKKKKKCTPGFPYNDDATIHKFHIGCTFIFLILTQFTMPMAGRTNQNAHSQMPMDC